ncbi:Protein flightless-1 [Gracilariopsis chorda]|uniref:Protein flightless-1 n=1 Tax=Gracilariopsis chorda TaxID=448386 RepID=A0A2V3ITR9_9FLOR|nr:Protein flightless-1 [Gracilariopsis chorda]|eukprot:PXF44510.1 Protein flightless-1 [Gracilariopsis chorda]
MPRRASAPETALPVTKRRRTTSSVARNQGQVVRRASERLKDKISPSDPTQVQFVHDTRRRVSTRQSTLPEHRSLPTSHTTRAPRPFTSTESDDAVTVVPSTATDPKQVIRLFNWQLAAYDKDNANSVLERMLREQPKYIDLSFLGLSDADLRALLEQPFPPISKGGRHIELNNNRLQRITEFLFGRLHFLKVISLTLSCNKLKDIHPSISLCKHLRTLELSCNELKAIPEEVVGLKNIECLNLSSNRITKLPPSFKELRKLKILNVAHNKLECLPDDVAQAGSALTALDISHNPSFNFLPKSCENWTVLEDLMLQGTQLHGHLSRKELGLSATRLVKEIAGRPCNSSRPRTRRKRPLRSRSAPETSVEAVDDDNVVNVK